MSTDNKTWAPAFLADAKVGDEIAIHRQRIEWNGDKAAFIDYKLTGTVVSNDSVPAGPNMGKKVVLKLDNESLYENMHMLHCHIDIVLTRWTEFAAEHTTSNGGCGVDSRVPADRAVYRVWLNATCTYAYHEMAEHYIEACVTGGYVTAEMREAYIHEMHTI